jgi:HAMP domain-containing protein
MLHFIVVKMVVGPIRQLESAIRKADAGDFNAVVPYKAADEIGSLVTSYQKMLHTITDKAEEVRFQNTEIERQKRIMEGQAQYLERANASLRQNNTDLRQFMQREFLRVEELTRHKDTLIGIAREEAIYNGDMKKAFERITELGSLHLDVARVSIWLFRNGRGFVGTPQIHELELIDLYDNTNQIHTESARLKAEDYPHYFSALESMELIHTSDAVNDERTSEFTENYLKPLGIGAMLDVPIRDGNVIVGVLCAEHVGSTRLWTIEEQIFARSLAGFVTTALDAREKLRQRERMADLNKELLLTNTDIQEKNIALQNAQDAAAQTLLYINHQNKLLETKTKELAEANEHLQDKQRLLTEINELLDDAHKQLNQQNELLKGKNEEATLNVLSLKDQNSALRLTHEELQAAYAEIKRQHEILEQQSRQAAAMTEEVQSKNALLLDANTELSGVYRELRRQNELLQEQAVTIEVANTELQEKNLRLVQIDQ